MAEKLTLTQTIVQSLFLVEQLDAIFLDLVTLGSLADQPELSAFTDQDIKGSKQKILYLEKIISGFISPQLRTALQKVIKEQNLAFFGHSRLLEFTEELQVLTEDILVIKISLAKNFKEADLKEMTDFMGKKMGQPVAFDIQVEASLIGGAIIRYGNYINDYSLKSRISQFREHWEKAVTP